VALPPGRRQAWFDADNPSKTTSTDYKTDYQSPALAGRSTESTGFLLVGDWSPLARLPPARLFCARKDPRIRQAAAGSKDTRVNVRFRSTSHFQLSSVPPAALYTFQMTQFPDRKRHQTCLPCATA